MKHIWLVITVKTENIESIISDIQKLLKKTDKGFMEISEDKKNISIDRSKLIFAKNLLKSHLEDN